MSADRLSFDVLSVVGYADDLPTDLLPRLVAPIFRLQTDGQLFVLPPYLITTEGVSNFALTAETDFDHAILLGQATRIAPLPARPDHRLWIDLDYSPRYESSDEASRHLTELARDHARRAKTALSSFQYEQAAHLAQVAISADERCLDALLVKAIVHRRRGEEDAVEVLRDVAQIVSPDVDLSSWIDMYSPRAVHVDESAESHLPTVLILDTTLCGGENGPGFSMDMEQKVRFARQLDELNVDIVEAGFPVASEAERETIRRVALEIRRPIIAALSRCIPADIECAGQAVKSAARSRINTFIATSDLHLDQKLRISREQCLEMVVASVKHARQFTDDVQFSAEDAARTNRDFLSRVVEGAIGAGATTICLPDTVGYGTPDEMVELFTQVMATVPNADRAVFSVRCKNDLGLAVANCLGALQAGARQVECTVNGIGERAGNASLEEIVMISRVRERRVGFVTHVRTTQLLPASRLLAQLTGEPVQANKAIVGRNAFAHEAGIHQDGVLKNRRTYEIMNPEDVGGSKTTLVLGKHSGRHAIQKRCEDLGFVLSKPEIDYVHRQVLAIAARLKQVSEAELIACIERAKESARSDSEEKSELSAASRDHSSQFELGEIEAALMRHRAIVKAVVMEREDTVGDRGLVAYVEFPPITAVPLVALHAFLERTLPSNMIPTRFVIVDVWPVNADGAVDLQALPVPSEEPVSLASDFIAPRTPTEERLATIWRELLDMPQVGIRDNFFHLGGHSLLAIRLVARVEKEFGVLLPIQGVFDEPTLEDLANYIAPGSSVANVIPNDAPTGDAGVTPATRIARPSEEKFLFEIMPSAGAGQPFFWVHGIGGELFRYLDVSQHLATARPVFGFTVNWSHVLGDDAPTLEAIAAHYVRALRQRFPFGPYHLGGYASAALLALEMARQLEADNSPVGVLAVLGDVIDSNFDSTGTGNASAFLRNLPNWRKDAMPSNWNALIDLLTLHGRTLVRRLRGRLWRYRRSDAAVDPDVGRALAMWRFPDWQFSEVQTHFTAFLSYQAKPFGGKVTLFRPRTAPLLGPWPKGDERWQKLARGGVEVREVRGSQLTMLFEPFAEALATHLDAAMEQAERAHRHVQSNVSANVGSRHA